MSRSRDLPAQQLAGFSESAVEQVRVRVLPDGRISREDAARYLGHTSSQTLATWQVQGKGPRSVKVGGRIFYFREDLDAFVRNGEQETTVNAEAFSIGTPSDLSEG
jgi:hypothetical protein